MLPPPAPSCSSRLVAKLAWSAWSCLQFLDQPPSLLHASPGSRHRRPERESSASRDCASANTGWALARGHAKASRSGGRWP